MEKKSRGKMTLRIILSILAAIAIWIYVDLGQGTSVKTTLWDIPVEFSGENGALADRGLMILSGYDTTVDLRIEGPRRELWKLDKKAVRVVADVSGITEVGIQSLNYDVIYPDNISRSDLKLDWRSAYTITVTVGELYTKEIPIYCDVTGTAADGYFAESVLLDPEVLVLRGRRDDLLNVSYAKIALDISGANKTVVQGVSYRLYDYNDILLENENIRASVSKVQAVMPIYTTAVVPLRILFEEAPGSTTATMNCTIQPSAVTLKGEEAVLSAVDSIVLDTLYLQDLSASQTLSYTIPVPENTMLLEGPEEATVTIVITGVEERSVDVFSFAFANVPDGCEAAAVTESLRITLRGLTEEIEALEADDVAVTADLSGITVPGSYTVPVNVTVNGYTNVSAKGSYQIIVSVTARQQENGATEHGSQG